MNLLALTCATLDAHAVPHAVIGATALAVCGVTRATADIDLLVTDPRCLGPAVWSTAVPTGTAVDIRRGDADDPLAGVIRITRGDEISVDIIVGRARWQTAILERAVRTTLAGVSVPVASPADLVLLKLYAGGPQDAWDIDQLLDAVPNLAASVEPQLLALPAECAALWQRIVTRS